MKGGDVILLYALSALKDGGQLDRMHVVGRVHGRRGGLRHAARHRARRARRGGAGRRRGARLRGRRRRSAHRGRSRDAAPARGISSRPGTPAHSSQIFKPEVGAGAVYEASRILTEFYTKLRSEAVSHVQSRPRARRHAREDRTAPAPTARRPASGTSSPSTWTVAGDLRTLSPEQLVKAKATMQAIVAQAPAEDVRRDHVRRRLSADGADGGQPAAARDVRQGEPRPRRRAGRGGRSVARRRGRRLVRRAASSR